MMSKKNSYLKAFLLTLLLLLFPILSGAVISIARLEGNAAAVAQTLAFIAAFAVGVALSKKLGGAGAAGLRNCCFKSGKTYLWFIPIFLIEIIPYMFGLKEGLKLSDVLIYLLFAASVALAEELYFRGLIPRLLRGKSLNKIIITSSLLFGFAHIINLLAGKDMLSALLQIVFALCFGVTTVLIAMATQSIMISALWHMLHNFTAMITAENDGTRSLAAASVQILILIIYAVILWRRKPDALASYKSEEISTQDQ